MQINDSCIGVRWKLSYGREIGCEVFEIFIEMSFMRKKIIKILQRGIVIFRCHRLIVTTETSPDSIVYVAFAAPWKTSL